MLFPKPPPREKKRPKPLKRTPLKRRTKLRSRGMTPIPADVRAAVVERDGGVCVLCQKPYDDIAHVWISRNAGGPMAAWNLCCLTRDCHAETHRNPAKRRELLEKMTARGIVPPEGWRVKG